MTAKFDRAFAVLLQQEGGYSNNPKDRGAATNYGVSQARYPNLDVASLTVEQAKEIYRADYWQKYQCEALPWPLAMLLFDCVVNHAPLNPIRWLQTAVGAYPDGTLGPRTLAAVKACLDPVNAARDMTSQRIEYVKRLDGYSTFGRGWHKRHVAVLTEAVRWAHLFNNEPRRAI